MSQMLSRMFAALCALVIPFAVDAQTCVGLPGPEGGRVQLGIGFGSSSGFRDISTYVGGVGSSVFGQTSSTTARYDAAQSNTREDAWTQGADIGYRMSIGTRGSTELCPIVGGSIGDVKALIVTGERTVSWQRIASTRSANVGVSLGHRVPVKNGFTVIPAVRASLVRSFIDYKNVDVQNSNSYGTMMISTGLLLGSRFTVYPAVSIPVGLEDADPRWGVSFTLSFWQRKP